MYGGCFVVRVLGIGPRTSVLSGQRSTTELYTPTFFELRRCEARLLRWITITNFQVFSSSILHYHYILYDGGGYEDRIRGLSENFWLCSAASFRKMVIVTGYMCQLLLFVRRFAYFPTLHCIDDLIEFALHHTLDV